MNDKRKNRYNEQTCSLQLSDSLSLWAYWIWQTVHSTSARYHHPDSCPPNEVAGPYMAFGRQCQMKLMMTGS